MARFIDSDDKALHLSTNPAMVFRIQTGVQTAYDFLSLP